FASDQAKIHSQAGSFLGATEIYLMNANCLNRPVTCVQNLRQITNSGVTGGSDSPAWSKDSRSLVFACGKSVDNHFYYNICTINIDGTNLRRLTNLPENELRPAWSSDQKYIAFTRVNSTSLLSGVAVLAVDTRQIRDIVYSSTSDAAFVFWMTI